MSKNADWPFLRNPVGMCLSFIFDSLKILNYCDFVKIENNSRVFLQKNYFEGCLATKKKFFRLQNEVSGREVVSQTLPYF